MTNAKYIVVGSGIFGSVIAERIASVLHEPVVVIEKRSHIGGNCYSEIDRETGIECHRYGSHIFHTASEKVWNYIRRFSDFTNYRHKVFTISDGKVYSMPINLKTICDVYQTSLSPSEAEKWIAQKRKEIDNPELSLEAKAISLIGRELYEKFIRGYTIKQWNKSPSELPAGIISRLPVRLNFNSDYFSDPFQGIPTNGYSSLFKRLLENDRISILLNTEFSAVRSQLPPSAVVIYTGMLDEYFDYTLGELEWRSLKFSWEAHPVQDFQGTAVMNYADESIPYTRIHEFKHYHPERRDIFTSPHTVICREFSRGWMRGQEAYYPVNTIRNQNLFEEYEKLAGTRKNLIFGGRLGRYSYWNMDQAIENALEIFEKKIFIAHKNI